MFTGIVTDIGEIASLEKRGDLQARILCAPATARAELGASIACDGACLTVIASGETEDGRGWFEVDVSAETVAKTNLSAWTPGARINLERALKVGDELGGHIVTGHVDAPAEILSMTEEGDSTRVLFRAPDHLAKFIAPKGSVCLNGTSLTVNEVEGATFGVNLIPHTKTVTTWGLRKPGDRVNLEIDTLARYVARLNEAAG
ncbi:riboflavin synthase [Albimonas sp. CAU 1670]|uniref:riboflavin synthase n=1 Tax=Albimonas sp. CAU 1670 TaxID=3032599 RepID=UPI0023DB7715|nr:riboflavin synthase [Albimonas sp. CAU 1670]MDF2231687.1 riboflavin synthase [Albimonas sp. CAU 1670]